MVGRYRTTLLVLLIFLLSASFLLSVSSFQRGHEWGSDFCHYLAQSKALLETNINEFKGFYTFTFDNSLSKPGPIFTPWGFPILLMPVWAIFGDSIVAFKAYSYLFLFFTLILFYLLSRRYLNQMPAVVLTGMLAFHPQLYEFREIVQSDTPHLFFVILNLYLVDLFLFERKKVRHWVFYLLMGISLYFAFMVKTIGVLLMATLFLMHFIILMREKNLNLRYMLNSYAEFIPYVIFVFLFVLEKLMLPSSHSTYSFTYDHSFAGTIFVNAKVYIRTLYEFLSLFKTGGLLIDGLNAGVLIASLLCVVYAIKGLKIRIGHVLIYTVLSFCILLPMPFNGGGFRYLLPVMFLYMILFFAGIQAIYTTLKTKLMLNNRYRIVKYLVFLLLVPWVLQTSLKSFDNIGDRNIIEGPYMPESVKMFDYIRENAGSNESVIFFKPRAMNYYTHKYSYRILGPREKTNETYFQNLKKLDWNYLVLLNDKIDFDLNLLEEYDLVFSNSKFLVYKNLNHLNQSK